MTDKTKSKSAFTLAEVLITLVIIGVVAAMTIPTAINKYKDQELKSQFAKAYSTISQTIQKTEMIDYYGYAKCFYNDSVSGQVNSDCYNFFRTAFSKNLQVQKVCASNALLNGCIPEYKVYSTNSGTDGFSKSNIENNTPAYVLSNGIIIIPYRWFLPLFMVDINGHKGPNAYGKDCFIFLLKRNSAKGLYMVAGGGINPVSGGRTTGDMMLYALAGKN